MSLIRRILIWYLRVYQSCYEQRNVIQKNSPAGLKVYVLYSYGTLGMLILIPMAGLFGLIHLLCLSLGSHAFGRALAWPFLRRNSWIAAAAFWVWMYVLWVAQNWLGRRAQAFQCKFSKIESELESEETIDQLALIMANREKRLHEAALDTEKNAGVVDQRGNKAVAVVANLDEYDIVDRPYCRLTPVVLEKLFPDAKIRLQAKEILANCDLTERARVTMAILRLANGDIDKLKYWAGFAESDWRDALCAGEYPLTAHKWKLRKEQPAKYIQLFKKEQKQYDDWIAQIVGNEQFPKEW